MSIYREKIILTYKYLLDVHEELLTRTINVGMTGELAEVNKIFVVGDTYSFDIEQFKDTPDTNLNKLIDFYDKLENLMNTLANINAITEGSWRNLRRKMNRRTMMISLKKPPTKEYLLRHISS